MPSSALSHVIHIALSITLFWPFCSIAADDEEGIAADYEIKAAFIYNFPSFVTWPKTAFESSDSDFVICTLGMSDSRFKRALSRAIDGSNVGQHKMRLEMFRAAEDVEEVKRMCQLVFVDDSERNHFDTINQQLSQSPILLVSDGTDYLDRGGMIRLYRKYPNIRIELNNCILKKAGLVADPHFLDLVEHYQSTCP